MPLFAATLAAIAIICLAQDNSQTKTSKKIQFPPPNLTSPVSLEQTMANRRSTRQFSDQPLTLEQIGQLAWAGQGITDPATGFRTAPSAGALYPIKLYFAKKEGLSVYNPLEHTLEEILSLDIRERLRAAALQQDPVASAPCCIIIAGSARKLAPKYGPKARRYMLLEAGHIAQNILLQATALKLASVPIGAFDIINVRKICRLPSNTEPLYIICVGYPAGQPAITTE